MSSRTLRTVVIGLAAVVVVFLVVEAFGKDSKSTTTTTTASQAEAWAEGTCNALVSWRSDVAAAAASLRAKPTRDNAQHAVDQAKTATLTLTDSLSALGSPGTSAGGKAKDTVDALRTQMQTGLAKIQNAGKTPSRMEAVSTISSTLATMRDQLAAAGNTLRNLPGGELEQAIAAAPSCTKLKNGGSAS